MLAMPSPDYEKLLSDLSEKFHKISMSNAAKGIIERDGHKLSTIMFEKIQGDILKDEQVDKLCHEGFEACVMALHAMGAKDVTIHVCNPTEGQ
jgi:hypothetical protein